jgi:hypothetical protein
MSSRKVLTSNHFRPTLLCGCTDQSDGELSTGQSAGERRLARRRFPVLPSKPGPGSSYPCATDPTGPQTGADPTSAVHPEGRWRPLLRPTLPSTGAQFGPLSTCSVLGECQRDIGPWVTPAAQRTSALSTSCSIGEVQGRWPADYRACLAVLALGRPGNKCTGALSNRVPTDVARHGPSHHGLAGRLRTGRLCAAWLTPPAHIRVASLALVNNAS